MTIETRDPAVDTLNREIEAAKGLIAEERLGEAIEAFTSIVERWPSVDRIYPVLCNLTLMDGTTAPRPAWIVKAVAQDATLVEPLHDLATRLFSEGEFARARDVLEALLTAVPDDAGLRHELGVLHFRLGDLEAAEKAYRAALASDGGMREARMSLTHMLLVGNRPEEARALCTDHRDVLMDAARKITGDAPAAPETAASPAGGEPTTVEVVGDPDGALEVRCEVLVARGPERRTRVTVRSERPAKPRVLSLDVYPSENPGHPERHRGYWNRDIHVPAGGEVSVDVVWNWAEGTVTFDGEAPTSAWHGPLDEDGEHVLTFVVYEDERPIAREHVKQWIGKPRLKSALWFMTYRCNMKCPYCWEVQRIAEGELKPDPFQPAEKVAAAWNRLVPGILDLSGGEPFLQPNFLDMLDALDDRIRVAITTNLSFDMTDFVQRISPEKVFSMTLSLHPTQRLKFDHFLGRALLLKNRGFNLTVNYVAWPEQLWLIPHYKEMVERVGLRFHVDPYAPTPHRPFEFTDTEKDFLREFVGDDRRGHWFGEVDKTPVLCSGGFDHLNVQPDGEAFRCIGDKVWSKPSIGNIFDEDFSLNDDWTRCGDYWRCPACDKDKVQIERIESESSSVRPSGGEARL